MIWLQTLADAKNRQSVLSALNEIKITDEASFIENEDALHAEISKCTSADMMDTIIRNLIIVRELLDKKKDKIAIQTLNSLINELAYRICSSCAKNYLTIMSEAESFVNDLTNDSLAEKAKQKDYQESAVYRQELQTIQDKLTKLISDMGISMFETEEEIKTLLNSQLLLLTNLKNEIDGILKNASIKKEVFNSTKISITNICKNFPNALESFKTRVNDLIGYQKTTIMAVKPSTDSLRKRAGLSFISNLGCLPAARVKVDTNHNSQNREEMGTTLNLKRFGF